MRKRDYLKIQKTKYLHVYSPHAQPRFALDFKTPCFAILYIVISLANFILLFKSVKCSMLVHLIIHFPSCELLISSSHFSILYFQHQFTSIPGSPRIVTRLPLPHSPIWSIIPLFPPFHPFCIILTSSFSITAPASIFQPLQQCCKLIGFIFVYLPAIYYSPFPSPCTYPPLPLL